MQHTDTGNCLCDHLGCRLSRIDRLLRMPIQDSGEITVATRSEGEVNSSMLTPEVPSGLPASISMETNSSSLFGSGQPATEPKPTLKRKATDLNLEIVTIDKMYDLTLIVGTPEQSRARCCDEAGRGGRGEALAAQSNVQYKIVDVPAAAPGPSSNTHLFRSQICCDVNDVVGATVLSMRS
jgi:hypothetical protein